LRAVVTEALAAVTCPYCGWTLTEANFSFDHHNPISRGGDFSIGNTLVGPAMFMKSGDPRISMLRRFATALGVDLEELTG
jgi:hypothetical protein